MVDMRFGHGTWRGIVDERARRIKEAKEAAIAKRRAEQLRQNEIMENIKMGTIVCVLIIIAAGLFITVVASVS
jgi:uncharacterized membrane protein